MAKKRQRTRHIENYKLKLNGILRSISNRAALRGTTMKDEYWENCPYSEGGQCPQPDAIARVYLIPQLLGSAEIDEIKKLCRSCGKYLNEKRKHPRLRKPFRIILHAGKRNTIPGQVVNISEGGALIKLQNWSGFSKNEKVILEIYPWQGGAGQVSASIIKVSGMIRRIEDQKHQVSVVFIKNIH